MSSLPFPLFHYYVLCTCIVSADVIDEVEGLRQRDIDMAAYQPGPVPGLEMCFFPQTTMFILIERKLKNSFNFNFE